MPERLRVGILCDGLVFQRWQAECIRQVLAVEGVDPVVLVTHEKPATAEQPFAQRMLRYPWRTALFLWYRRKRLKPAAYAPEDLSAVLGHVPTLACRPIGPDTAQHIEADDLAAIAHYRPDVLLRFGFDALKGDILTLPRHGVWSYHHGDQEKYRGQPPGFWEIMRGDPVTGAVLERLAESADAGRVLRKGWFRTIDHSLADTLDSVLFGSAGWAAQVCRELVLAHANAADGTASGTHTPVRRYPGNADVIRFLLTCNSNRVAFRQQRSKLREEWNIGVLYQPIRGLLDAKPNLNVRWLPSPSPGQFRSSPFGYMADGQLNVLYEKFDHGTGKGEISRLRPKRDNVLKRSRTLLAGEHRFSQPFVVERDGRVMVIPESAAGRVDLYGLNEANDALEHMRTLLDEPLLSPTLFEHDGRWWMFGTKAPLDDVALYAFHAPSLTGPWTPHVLNPLKMDIRSARPAGMPFSHDGQLYRPAQDHSAQHGWRIALMRVTELTPTAFQEELVKTIGPLKGSAWSQGTRTISAVGNLTLVDGMRLVTAGQEARSQRSSKKKGTKGRTRTERSDEDDDDDD